MTENGDPRQFVRRAVADLQPYSPVTSPEALAQRLGMPINRIVKLDSNENPYGCSIQVQETLGAFDRYSMYPDAQAQRVRERLAIYAGSKVDRIIAGNGSDEIIDLLMLVTIDPEDEVIIPEPTFGVYRARAELFGANVVTVDRLENFDLDIDGIAAAVTDRTKLIMVCSPNNPTGNPVNHQDIVRLLRLGPLVVVDEAYFEFSGKTVVPLMGEFDNLIVLRTFSKWAGIAGLRFGYAMLPQGIAENIWKVKAPFNVNVAALLAVEASLDDVEYLHLTINLIRNEQRRLSRRLSEIGVLEPLPSAANFLLCRAVDGDAGDIFLRLEDRGIMVRRLGGERLKNYLRVSVGRPEDTDRLISALQTIAARV